MKFASVMWQMCDESFVQRAKISPEVPKLNHALMNKKRDQIEFPLARKRTRKKKMDSSNCPTHYSTSRWIVL